MKTSELRDFSSDEIGTKIKDLKEELFNLRFQHAVGQLENTSSMKKVKKSIARAKTVLNQKANN